MFKRYKVFILVLAVVAFILLNDSSAKSKDIRLFEDIISLTNANLEEVGVQFRYTVADYGKEVVEDVFNRLDLNEIDSVDFASDHGNLSLNFASREIRGSIENIKEDKDSFIVINIKQKAAKGNLEELKFKIEKSINISSKKIQYSQYIKAKLLTDDLSSINDQLQSYLKNIGASNVDSIEINNGYSTIAFTRHFEPIKYGDKLMDFNYALVTYSSGSYIILGTPIIMSPY